MKYSLTRISKNTKTGLIPVTYSNKNTCPDNCALKGSGCYAEGGHVNIHFEKLTKGERGIDYSDLITEIETIKRGQLWRHNVSGDLVADKDNKELICSDSLKQLVKANKNKKGFTYTHYNPNNLRNLGAIAYANYNGFTINISTEDHATAYKYHSKGMPVVTLLDENAPKVTPLNDTKIIRCPATNKSTTQITCADCKLCAIDNRDFIIGFPVHGFRKNQITVKTL